MTTKTRELTTDDIEAGYDLPDYEGFGYLGERARSGRIAYMQAADAAVLDAANALGWTADELFDWTNSKLGRWFGDATFGSFDPTKGSALYFANICRNAARTYITEGWKVR